MAAILLGLPPRYWARRGTTDATEQRDTMMAIRAPGARPDAFGMSLMRREPSIHVDAARGAGPESAMTAGGLIP